MAYRKRCGIQEEVCIQEEVWHTGRGVAYRKWCGMQEEVWHTGRAGPAEAYIKW